MYSYEFSTNGIEISAENRILMEEEILLKIGQTQEIIYTTDIITIVTDDELDISLQLELYNIISKYIIYIDPQELKNKMCNTLQSLTTTELNILKISTDAIYNRSLAIALRRELCNKYQEATEEELELYDAEFKRLGMY